MSPLEKRVEAALKNASRGLQHARFHALYGGSPHTASEELRDVLVEVSTAIKILDSFAIEDELDEGIR